MVGRTLQRYRIVEEVGHGGMAVVYRGVDETLERDVAVKLLHPHLAARPEHRRRLAREAKAVARLRHPNILEIYDFSGEDSPEAFLLMEFIRGRTLRAFAQEHPFDPPEIAAACIHVLAGALAHAHEAGIVHRDLKPDNVMIHEAGEQPVIKLMDFGIAQIIDRDERMTMTGSLMGSPAHMAPEIIDGEEADARSDIFSLGTILYWLVTGQLPFEAPSPGALLKKILEGEFTDPRLLRPAVSDSLAQIISDALARDRNRRIESARSFQSRLAEALAEVEIERPEELLGRFLKSPLPVSSETREGIVLSLMRQGARAAAAGRTARALKCYSRVVTIVPGTSEAGEARQAIDSFKRRGVWRRTSIGALSALALGGTLLLLNSEQPSPQPEPLPVLPQPTLPGIEAAQPELLPQPAPPSPSTSEPESPPSPARPLPTSLQPPRARRVEAPPKPARLSVHVKDVWARVLIDGVHKGQTPYEADTSPGEHRIRLEADCCRPVEFETSLSPGEQRDVRQVLEPLPASLELVVKGPEDAGVMIDEQFEAYVSELARKPLAVHMLRESGDWNYDRTVRLRVFADGHLDHVSEVRLRAGQKRVLEVSLSPKS